MRLFVTLCALLSLLALVSAVSPSERLEQFLAHLPYTVEEVDRAIAKEFLRQEVVGKTPEELLGKFAVFKKEWVDKMI